MKFILPAVLLSSLCVLAQNVPAKPAAPADPCANLKTVKKQAYGFHPAEVSDAEREARSKKMDQFWTAARDKGPAGVKCVREMILAEKEDNFFSFDAAALLLNLDKSEASLDAIQTGVGRADLRDVDPAGYTSVLLRLAREGVDIGPLADKYLRAPKVDASLPEHFGMRVDRQLGATLLYGSMPAAMAEKYTIPALAAPEDYVRAAAATALAFDMTDASFRALNSFSGMGALPKEIRNTVADIMTERRVPLPPAKWKRDEVIKIIRRMPNTEEEFQRALKEEDAWLREHHKTPAKPQTPAQADLQEEQEAEEHEPFVGIAGAKRFLQSAVATLTADDLDLLREARRKSIHSLSDESADEYFAYTFVILGVINRLDLYREFRGH